MLQPENQPMCLRYDDTALMTRDYKSLRRSLQPGLSHARESTLVAGFSLPSFGIYRAGREKSRGMGVATKGTPRGQRARREHQK
eukprot:scaffold107702_cov34-Tisochrysis_lutea.AAC.4